MKTFDKVMHFTLGMALFSTITLVVGWALLAVWSVLTLTAYQMVFG